MSYSDPQQITQKVGSGAGDYTRSTASFADVDGTNLALTVTVPLGWKALIVFSGWGNVTGGGTFDIAIADGTSNLRQIQHNAATNTAFSLQAVFTGDGASHAFKPRFQGDGSSTGTIKNAAAISAPVMTVTLISSP